MTVIDSNVIIRSLKFILSYVVELAFALPDSRSKQNKNVSAVCLYFVSWLFNFILNKKMLLKINAQVVLVHSDNYQSEFYIHTILHATICLHSLFLEIITHILINVHT